MNPWLLLLFICCSIQSVAQTPYKKSAKPVDTIHTLPLDRFVTQLFWWDGCVSKNERDYDRFVETGRDTSYVYYFLKTLKDVRRYKVSIKDLERIKYDTCMAYNINKMFFDTFVEKKDRTRNPDKSLCPTTTESAYYKHKYIDSLNAVEIQLHWRIYCEILIKLVNKRYKGIYYFDTGELKKID